MGSMRTASGIVDEFAGLRGLGAVLPTPGPIREPTGGRALCTETVVNDALSGGQATTFRVGRRLNNLDDVKWIGFAANRRVLGVQCISRHCQLGLEAFEDPHRPTVVDDRAPLELGPLVRRFDRHVERLWLGRKLAARKFGSTVRMGAAQERQRGSAPDRAAVGTPLWRPVLANPTPCRCRHGRPRALRAR